MGSCLDTTSPLAKNCYYSVPNGSRCQEEIDSGSVLVPCDDCALYIQADSRPEHLMQFHYRLCREDQWTDRQFLRCQLVQGGPVFAQVVEDDNNNSMPFLLNWATVHGNNPVFWVSQYFPSNEPQYEFTILVLDTKETRVLQSCTKPCLPHFPDKECKGVDTDGVFVLQPDLYDDATDSGGILFCRIRIRRLGTEEDSTEPCLCLASHD